MYRVVLIALCVSLAAAVPVQLDPEAEVIQQYEPFPAPPVHSLRPVFSLDLGELFSGFAARPLFGDNFGGSFFGLQPAARPAITDCDSGRFHVNIDDYNTASTCEQQYSDNERLRRCIVDGIRSQEAREFINREDLRLVGISLSSDTNFVDGVLKKKHIFSVRMCPMDDINMIEPPRVDSLPGAAANTGVSVALPEIKIPNITGLFSSILDSFNFDHSSTNSQTGSTSPLWPSFTEIKFPNVDMDSCSSERFNVDLSVYNKIMRCQSDSDPAQCVQQNVEINDQTRPLIQYVSKPGYSIIGQSFYSYTASVNGETTEKHNVRVQRCANKSPDSSDTQGPYGGQQTVDDFPSVQQSSVDNDADQQITQAVDEKYFEP